MSPMGGIQLFLSIFLLSAAFMFLVNLLALRRGVALERRGERAAGECVEHFWPAGGYVGIVVRFRDGDGEERTVKSSKYRTPPLDVGEAATVFYEPGGRGRAMISFEAERRVGFDVFMCCFMGALALGSLVGIVATF